MNRAPDMTKRDLLIGILAGAAVAAGLHPALDITAAAAGDPFDGYEPPKRWYPSISKTHARMAIYYAGRMHRAGKLTDDEYIWICEKARMAILKPVLDHSPGLREVIAGARREKTYHAYPV